MTVLVLQSDIKKVMDDGKTVIIEGTHLDPSLLLPLIQKYHNTNGIIVPILLTLDEKNHRNFIHKWLQRKESLIQFEVLFTVCVFIDSI